MTTQPTDFPNHPGDSTAVAVDRGTALRRAKIMFFVAAGLSFVLSVSLWFSGEQERGLFVGLWVPSILAAGTLLLSGEERQ